MVTSLRLAGAIAAGLLVAVPLAAQKQVPATYAITGARVVPVSGPVVEKGTIVIRDGIITAVGPAVTVPADARVIDGTGLSVYPGLIDAYGSLGQASAATAAAAAGGRGGGRGAATPATTAAREPAPNSKYGVGLRPEVDVVDQLELDASEFDAAHAAGLTAALTAVPTGIFRGHAALIQLLGDSVADIVVRDGVAQSIGFSRGGGGFGGGRGGYPGTLFGAFASLRQELLDAEHYRDVKAAYDKNPRGVRRPDFDASLEALLPVLSREQPVIMQANTEREIIRALDLAREFNLNVAIAGGAEAYKVADRLKAQNVPVILTLNFPRAGTATGGGRGGGGRGGAAGADEPEPLRLLRDRVMAPKGPGLLAKAGVRFAFESGADYTDMLANVRKAVAAGLPSDEALRALTWNTAQLFDVSDRLGSIETGKIADLTITRGDILTAESRVTQLFIDGKPVDVPVATPANGGGNAGGRGGRPGADISGTWAATLTIDGRDRRVTLHLRQDEGRLYGVVEGDLGSSDILEGEVDWDGSFAFTATLSLVGGTTEVEFDGRLDRDSIRGSVLAEDHAGGTFAGSHSR